MKRFSWWRPVRVVLICAILNVGVAWFAALWSPGFPPGAVFFSLPPTKYAAVKDPPNPPGHGSAARTIWVLRLNNATLPEPEWIDAYARRPDDRREVRTFAFGTPARCMLWSERRDVTSTVFSSADRSGALSLPMLASGGDEPPALPLTPIWTGLAINTAYYAGLVFLTDAVMGKLKKRAAARRARRAGDLPCSWCGYDLRATRAGSQCPECGKLPRHVPPPWPQHRGPAGKE
jgi:hypothetical protein